MCGLLSLLFDVRCPLNCSVTQCLSALSQLSKRDSVFCAVFEVDLPLLLSFKVIFLFNVKAFNQSLKSDVIFIVSQGKAAQQNLIKHLFNIEIRKKKT